MRRKTPRGLLHVSMMTLLAMTASFGCGPPLEGEELEVASGPQAMQCCDSPIDPNLPDPPVFPEYLCEPGSTRDCPSDPGCSEQVCVDGMAWSACTDNGSANCRCAPGSVTSCHPGAGACGQKTCSADGTSFGACTQVSCGKCTPGAKQACDYMGSARTSHCALGEQTCNAFGSGFSACADPKYQCGTWSSIDPRECAYTGVAKHVGVLADIPSGDSKQAYVLNHPAIVFGEVMTARAYSSDIWGNAWGTFAVRNSSCFVYNLSYLKTCTTSFSGSTLYLNPDTGLTFREFAGFPCTSSCFGTNERKVYNSEPRWGNEQFPLNGGFGGPPRCETVVGKTFEW